ncbi:MAG: hypothetical protein UY59_C0006G0015 [Candidatus Kaiserbacteria bacterium GW2011_GWA1_50_28]|uniref:Uncharacterized protein n=1 Tax=Candidatus Kaiserbacteria bacterium GW2011_GWA1_50_28 TaxID=1618668 RepID=A0A0G1ZGL1_9BACT|nr:MAG: hypothetical protein UY59_C0006G0015 [Candidatus Kaiserbacteria bacterium GW2011_GWA1_50_28]
MPRVDREFVHNFQFFVEKRERIVNGKIRARNTSSEEKALHDDDWNEPDPHGCRNRHEPHPQGAADGVRHKSGTQGAREKPAFLEEVTDDGDCPEKREVPHLASYRMCDEGNNGKRGHNDVKRHFSREVECGHGERQEPDKRRRVGEIHALCHKMESLHEKNSNDARNGAEKSSRDRSKGVEERKADGRTDKLHERHLERKDAEESKSRKKDNFVPCGFFHNCFGL